MNTAADRKLAAMGRWSLTVGLIAAAPCAVSAFSNLPPLQRLFAALPSQAGAFLQDLFDRQQFFQSYLLAFLFWWGVAVGALGLLMLTWLVRSNWGRAARPYLAAASLTLPLTALLFVPLALETEVLYVWARPEVVEQSPSLERKAPYLNVPFFLARAAGCFAIWTVGGLALSVYPARWNSLAADAGSQPNNWRRKVSGVGLVLFVATTTVAACDWSMSLDPAWYSTIYGALIGAGGMLTAMALVVILYAQTLPSDDRGGDAASHEGNEPPPPTQLLADLGSLLLALVMIWAYFAFSQFMIIWSANLPVEASWYLLRLQGGWQWSALSLLALHFAAPFLLLLSRETKSSPVRMTAIGLLLLAVHLVALHWHVAPVFHPDRFHFAWTDVAAPLAMGGIWLFLFLRLLRRRLHAPGEATS
ncbi:MAG: hypothetical protein RIC55_23645 [Pirellulaceae bacterium]